MAADQQADRPQRQRARPATASSCSICTACSCTPPSARATPINRGHQQREHHRHRQSRQQRCRRRHRQRALEGQQAAFTVQRQLHAEAEQGRGHRTEHAVGGQQVQRCMAAPNSTPNNR
jgi:hypothetical protein